MRLNSAYNLGNRGKGLVSLFSFDEKTRRIHKLVQLQNLILYGGAGIMARVLAGQREYAINVVYMEYKNTSGAIVPPSVTRADGIEYYTGLSASPDTDFLRIPLLVNPTLNASEADYESNEVTFFAESEGTQGFWGKDYSQSADSHVFGAALVAAPDLNDQSKDIVFSRVYVGELATWGTPVDKQDGKQVGLTWTIQLK